MNRLSAATFAALALAACGSTSQPTGDERARLEAEFAESMRNVVMEGHFTVTGRGDDARIRPERYEVKDAVHVAGDIWTINARIQYGDHDFTAPIPVKLLWAGDTPVISLTDVSLPGSDGAFTARVVIFRDHYSGMWWHGETGGNQFGRIVRESNGASTVP